MLMTKRLTVSLLALAALSACSSTSENRRLDQKLAQTDVHSSAQLDTQAQQLARATPGLDDNQRRELDQLRASVHDKLAALSAESLKLRSLLIKDTLASKPDTKELSYVKNRLKQVSKDRLDTIFGAADQANEILGRNELVRQAMDLQFIEDDFNYY